MATNGPNDKQDTFYHSLDPSVDPIHFLLEINILLIFYFVCFVVIIMYVKIKLYTVPMYTKKQQPKNCPRLKWQIVYQNVL